MEHNLFKFTVRFNVDEGQPAKSAIQDYLEYVTDNFIQDPAHLDEIYTLPYHSSRALSYIKLIAHDYGVIQVGVGIINKWMFRLFTCPADFGVLVEAIVAHPMNNLVSGALIRWDRDNNVPIIHELGL